MSSSSWRRHGPARRGEETVVRRRCLQRWRRREGTRRFQLREQPGDLPGIQRQEVMICFWRRKISPSGAAAGRSQLVWLAMYCSPVTLSRSPHQRAQIAVVKTTDELLKQRQRHE